MPYTPAYHSVELSAESLSATQCWLIEVNNASLLERRGIIAAAWCLFPEIQILEVHIDAEWSRYGSAPAV